MNEAVWNNYDSARQIESKLELIKSWIPQEVDTIVDVGCGNGIISNYLGLSYDLTAVDVSEKALEQVNTKKIKASATDLSFADRSFDLVFCCEMLEHLTSRDLRLAVSKFNRIAQGYLLISVPNQEQLRKSMVKCRDCGKIFHPYGHLQVFTMQRLKQLFPDFTCIRQLVFGPEERAYHPLLLYIKNHLARQYFHPSSPIVCPDCHSVEYEFRTNLLSKICNQLNRVVSKRKPYWLIMLLKRK